MLTSVLPKKYIRSGSRAKAAVHEAISDAVQHHQVTADLSHQILQMPCMPNSWWLHVSYTASPGL